MKQIAIIHTSFVSLNDLKAFCAEIIPDVKVWNIVDDSLLPEVIAAGHLTAGVTRRVCAYAVEAQSLGVDFILNQCSSVGEAVDVARRMLDIPYLKIDEPMAREAVRLGSKISVIATVPTTLGPSSRLVESAAREAKKTVEVKQVLCEGAFDVLVREGNKEKHNAMVLDRIKTEEKTADVIVLAQGSMLALLPYLSEFKKPVLTSPRLGIEGVRSAIDGHGNGSRR